MSSKDDFLKAHALVHQARHLTTQHLHPGFYDFLSQDFDTLLFTLLLLTNQADHITPPKTEPTPP